MNPHLAAVTRSSAPIATHISLDFAEYLAQKRQMSREAALHMLGESVLDYRPDTEALRARRAELGVLLASELSESAA